jgi:hypothetical protein
VLYLVYQWSYQTFLHARDDTDHSDSEAVEESQASTAIDDQDQAIDNFITPIKEVSGYECEREPLDGATVATFLSTYGKQQRTIHEWQDCLCRWRGLRRGQPSNGGRGR